MKTATLAIQRLTLLGLLAFSPLATAFPALPPAGMTAEAATESGGDVAANVLDGSSATYWYPGDVVDRWLRIDLGARHIVSQFSQVPRDGSAYRVRDYEIYVSDHPGPAAGAGTFFLPQARTAWGDPVAVGAFPNDGSIKHVSFTPTVGRYVILRVGTAWNRPGIAQVWIHGSPFAVADPETGLLEFTHRDRVTVAVFPSMEGATHYQITAADGMPDPESDAWTPTNQPPQFVTFAAPVADTNLFLTAWFTNRNEAMTLTGVITRIAHASTTPNPVIKPVLRRETPGHPIVITGADLDAGSASGSFGGRPIGIHRLEALCAGMPTCDATPGAPYVTLTQPGVYALILRVINAAGSAAVTEETCQVTVTAMNDPPVGDRFVVKDNIWAVEPYHTWSNAAAGIQDAIDVAAVGETIRVWPGIYDAGGRPAAGSTLTNRVTLDKAVRLVAVSENPADTLIVGRWDPETFWTGDRAIRGVYLTGGASLAGFTVSNGATRAVNDDDGRGGIVWAAAASATVSNSVMIEGLAHQYAKVYRGTYHDCTLARAYGGEIRNVHSATLYDSWVVGRYPEGYYDGGLQNCTAYRTTITRGWSKYGGGAGGSILHACFLYDNRAGTGGGGATGSTLYNCIVSNNISRAGGAVRDSTVYHSILIHNRGTDSGAGATSGGTTLYNSLVIGNHTTGAAGSTLYNCTVVGNVRGISGGNAINSIIYYNQNGDNYINDPVFTHTCTYPEAVGWSADNLTNAPGFIRYDPGSGFGQAHVPGDYRLASGSPAFETGLNFDWLIEPAFAGDIRHRDLDGHPRIMPRGGRVDMGAYERQISIGTVVLLR